MTTFRPTRRSLLGTAALFIGADLLDIRSKSFGAEAGLMIQHVRVGEADVTILSDGTLIFPPKIVLADEPSSEIALVFSEHGSSQPSFEAQANIPVIRTADRLIIVDCGGADFMPTLGHFPDALKAAGFSPEDITDVIFTHGHPDHLWGAIDPLDDSVLFPRARLWMAEKEKSFWLRSGVERLVPQFQMGAAIGTQRRLLILSDRVETFVPGREVVPGLVAIETAGHTPGHISLQLTSKGENLFIGGDVLIHPIVSFARPQWHWHADCDMTEGAATRLRTLDMLSTDNLRVLGYHLPWPGLGRVEKEETAYKWNSEA